MARKARRIRGLGEASGRFVAADSLAAIFAAYGNACAFTGRDLSAEAAADPRGYLLHLSDDPGTGDATMLIPASLDAIFAFERGHLALNSQYEFLTNAHRISPEFATQLNAIGRLRLPSDPAFYPSQTALTPSLIAFATGRKSRQ